MTAAGRLGAVMESGSGSVSCGDGVYWLAAHVYLGLCDRHAVLMDLLGNRYHAVQPAEALAGWVYGWPVPGTRGHTRPRILEPLLAQGLLVRDVRLGRPATLAKPHEPFRTLLEFDFDGTPRTNLRAMIDLTLAWSAARLSLKFLPMRTVVERVSTRRAGRTVAGLSSDWEHAHALVMTFVHLRPWFYTVRRACLLDSLTLLNFLALRGMYPEWVFGVRTAPFHAHCWVQQEGTLYNDVPDRVRQYSPILRV